MSANRLGFNPPPAQADDETRSSRARRRAMRPHRNAAATSVLIASLAGGSILAMAVLPAARSSAPALPSGHPTQEDPKPGASPHWRPDGCPSCHEAGRSERAIGIEDVDVLCLRCHDGVHASREAHPIGRPAVTEQVSTPLGWPTRNGLLSCLTCHDVVRGCRSAATRPDWNPAFVRGWTPAGSAAYCIRCHDATAQARHNPHHPPGGGGADACLFCHTSAMPADRLERTGEPSLRSDEVSLCGACHVSHVEIFHPGHMGTAVAGPYLAALQAFEAHLAGDAARSTVDGRAALPLGDGGRIVCSTCHNPHARGVFDEASVLAIGALPRGSDVSGVALRWPSAMLCRACHAR